jgi:hypothetical protein
MKLGRRPNHCPKGKPNKVIAGLDIAGLVIASLLNVFLRQQQLKN